MSLEFKQLDSLRGYLDDLQKKQVASLKSYYKPHKGFYHRDKISLSHVSTSMCLCSLIAVGKLDVSSEKNGGLKIDAIKIIRALLDTKWKWTAAGLKKNNVFTSAFVLEAITKLQKYIDTREPQLISKMQRFHKNRRLKSAEQRLKKSISLGYAQVDDYPQCAYMTQLVVRTLQSRKLMSKKEAANVADWAWRQIDHELALLSMKSKTVDLFQLLYATMLAASLEPINKTLTPDQSVLLQTALKSFFAAQLSDNSWPRSRPLFHYPKVGSAYNYEYETLVQLLSVEELRPWLLEYLPQLEKSARALKTMQFQKSPDVYGWSSGHRPQVEGAESWATASAFHYAHALGRLVAEGIRKAVFDYLGAAYAVDLKPSTFAPGFVDCPSGIADASNSLRSLLLQYFVKPLAERAEQLDAGESLGKETPVAAILFGPPGTSKTALAKHIAAYLRWPLLSVDPSHFVRFGMDRVQAEADMIFNMLGVTEKVVVLFDEFDELVRERSNAVEMLSRFLTTAMLPKLTTISSNRRLAFLVATNHIEKFDIAISRPGRFDRLIQVLPPTTTAKLANAKWKAVKKHLTKNRVNIRNIKFPESQHSTERRGGLVRKKAKTKHPITVEDLTFAEFDVLQASLLNAKDKGSIKRLILTALEKCTMNEPVGGEMGVRQKKTWKVLCEEQKKKIRIQ